MTRNAALMRLLWQSSGASLFVALCCLLALCFPVSVAGQVLIDFEDLQPRVPVLSQYASKGVTFNGHLILDYSQIPGFAHSGTKAIELCFAAEFCTTPLNINFTTGEQHVKLWVGFSAPLSQASTVLLQALDSNNMVVGQASAVLGPSNSPIPVQTPLQIDSASSNIFQLVLTLAAPPGQQAYNNFLVADDLQFDTPGSPPLCGTTQNPVVGLAQPLNGQVVQVNEFPLQGFESTAVPLDSATLTVTNGGTTTSGDLLSGLVSRTSGNFGATQVFGMLSPGTNTVTVQVTNCSGASQASRTVVFSPIADGTRFKVLGMEVIQVTQDLRNTVPVVAGKPAIVRVYLSLEGPTTLINGVSADITATYPGAGGLGYVHSANSVTVDSSQDLPSKRLDLNKSLNFVLPPNWYAEGTLHFQIPYFYIQVEESSLPCDGCQLDQIDAPYWVHFQPTRALNLVLAPYAYLPHQAPPFPLTADIFFSPMGILQWVNNVYPLGGNFPEDGSGINLLRILPIQTTTRDLNHGGNDDFLGDLQNLMNDLQGQNHWPSDSHLLGMLPCGCGGEGYLSGNVGFGDTWASERGVVPQKNFESYGQIWAHEMGHNFGREHASNSHGEMPPTDPNFPYLHGSIGEPGLAIITEWWNSSPFLIAPGVPAPSGPYPHAHDFMSYGPVNDPAEHTFSWVSPYTYEALFSKFQQLARAVAPSRITPVEKLVISGRIHPDGTATLRPFHIVTTSFVSGSGTTGEYSVDLLDAGGRALLTYRFDAHRASESRSPAFSEFVPWKPGTRTIVLKGKAGVLAKRVVSPHKPWVRVTSPKGGETWGTKATVSWEAGDGDHDSLTFAVFYNDGRNPLWIPVADGLTKSPLVLDTTLLPGSTRARIRVRVTDGVNTAEADSDGTFSVPEKNPLVAILGPGHGQVLGPGSEAEFIGAAYDVQNGILPGTSLTWSSDRDGLMGQGQRLKVRTMSRGSHVVTLTATDKMGHTASARVSVVVGRDRLMPGKAGARAVPELNR